MNEMILAMAFWIPACLITLVLADIADDYGRRGK